ncbi:hypothetical protein Glove_60g157 [Diversispora epigaea]|uniref:Uncharacterized protein n=1 Tax=Diversispora epigaea TaxID=1348612 RepID=A0A397JBX1_9GLOM|nr:hypothetical protein Glove_60g157 [Diversispora epigaea]
MSILIVSIIEDSSSELRNKIHWQNRIIHLRNYDDDDGDDDDNDNDGYDDCDGDDVNNRMSQRARKTRKKGPKPGLSSLKGN